MRLKAAFRRSKALVPRCGSGECLGSRAPNSFSNHVVTHGSPAFGYNGNIARLQPNNSFKLMSLRGADFCGNVYHNAAPLRATA